MDNLTVCYRQSKGIDILVINETKLDSTIKDNKVHLPGYDIVRKDRENNARHGCGVCIYVQSNINFQIRADLSPSDIECLTIEISRPRSKLFLSLLGTDRHSHLVTFSLSLRGLLIKLMLKTWNYICWVTYIVIYYRTVSILTLPSS